jgi:hypothetical protein
MGRKLSEVLRCEVMISTDDLREDSTLPQQTSFMAFRDLPVHVRY